MGKQQKVNVREWLDQCAPDEVRDAITAMAEAGKSALRLLEDEDFGGYPSACHLRTALDALSEPQV